MTSAKVGPPLGVFVFAKIRIISVPVRNFFNFVTLLAEDNKLFLAPFGGTFRFVETSKGFAVVLDST